ncbi:hypothetical protein BFP97_14770 [Roseivirga sp. 4D4]|uniref:DUF4175 family protein n=1 Tax=Roseivirga sp. 4D4 TaxID=1889784 RepID=UPI000853AFEE|nr:DUF4175 family protein [Roseivirga sp. 4D4]OEK02709.1 hypothetical protein BFP97_14770 [Roseivirga sp. 4D4]
MGSNEALKNQLKAYKAKYYRNKAIKGAIVFAALILAFFLVINTVEFSGRLGSSGRAALLYAFIGFALVSFYGLVLRHILTIKNVSKQISNEEAALQIGKFFPEISDKLLNIIQLEKLSSKENELLLASIRQKSSSIQQVPFVNAIDLKANKRYLRYVYTPVAIIVALLIFLPQFITESSTRIIKYNSDFKAEAPFSFIIDTQQLEGFIDEPFTLSIETKGQLSPNDVFIWINERKIKVSKLGTDKFEYRIDRLRGDISFSLESEGILSDRYTIDAAFRPSIDLFSMDIEYPKYTLRENESIRNSGNLTVPEGTQVSWKFSTQHTESLSVLFANKNELVSAEDLNNGQFQIKKTIESSGPYSIQLQNEFSSNKDSLKFQIEVIKDRYPEIVLDQFQDTVLYKNIVLGGNIRDDYGFSSLSFHYSYDGERSYESFKIPFNRELSDQSYYQVYTLDSAKIQAGAELKYYMQVADNDAVNGSKAVKSATYSFKIPSLEDIEAEIEANDKQIQSEIDKTLEDARELNKMIEEADERLKTKKEIEWQDEKLMQEILDQKEKLAEKVDELKKENQLNNQKLEQFKPQNESIKQKMEQLQEIMNNVLDDEMKKLYDELRELLEEQSDIEEFRDKMDDLRENSSNLEEDLERTLELFKKLQFDKMLEDNIEKLQEEIDDQEALNKETQKGEKTNEELAEQQKKEQEDLEKLQEELDKLNELNQDRKNPDSLPEDLDEDLEEAKEEQQKAQEELNPEGQNSEGEKGENEENSQEKEQQKSEGQESQSEQQRQNASKAQKRAAEKMKEVKQSLQSMQSGAQMEQQQENLENLRDLVDNLVTLSFNQEGLMNEFKEIRQSDPRYVKLSQRQLKLQDDSKIIQDSLISLSQRVFQISSFVMRELGEMNRQMDGAVETLKEKRVSQAVGKQQFAMTSINNLALLLDDVVQQMQQQMASQMGKGSSKGNQKNKPQMGGLSELQQQLSEQIKELKESGMSGRQLSEQLAKLASQQERLRNALENFETGLDGNKLGEKIDQLINQMEENEWDLINKSITDETVQRQQDILTRLLEAENSVQERGEDEERKGRTAFDYDLSIPESLNEYLKAKEKEIELLRTIPAKLNPYYKKETNKYFKKIKEKN